MDSHLNPVELRCYLQSQVSRRDFVSCLSWRIFRWHDCRPRKASKQLNDSGNQCP